MKEYIERDCFKCFHYPVCKGDTDKHNYFGECKHFTPTADVEPVRHGEWKEETEYYDDEYSECNVRKVFVCSLCGKTEKYKQPYCNCGAKMDEAKQEKIFPRCNKCVYEITCSKNMDNENKCPDYKRDAPDGGYYG